MTECHKGMSPVTRQFLLSDSFSFCFFLLLSEFAASAELCDQHLDREEKLPQGLLCCPYLVPAPAPIKQIAKLLLTSRCRIHIFKNIGSGSAKSGASVTCIRWRMGEGSTSHQEDGDKVCEQWGSHQELGCDKWSRLPPLFFLNFVSTS